MRGPIHLMSRQSYRTQSYEHEGTEQESNNLLHMHLRHVPLGVLQQQSLDVFTFVHVCQCARIFPVPHTIEKIILCNPESDLDALLFSTYPGTLIITASKCKGIHLSCPRHTTTSDHGLKNGVSCRYCSPTCNSVIVPAPANLGGCGTPVL
jgi:hypothetical protein